MSEDIKNKYDKDFWFEQRLLLGVDQIDIIARFAEIESSFDTISLDTTTISNAITELGNSYNELQGLLDAHLQTRQLPNGGTANQLLAIAADGSTLEWFTDTHPNDKTVHLPAGGTNGKYVGMKNGSAAWLDVFPEGGSDRQVITAPGIWKNFDELLPKLLLDILESGGTVTPEEVIDAFQQITVSKWTTAGMPFGATRIKASIFAQDRFFVGDSSGKVSYTFDSIIWQAVQTLFGKPSPSAVEAFAYAETEDGKTPILALDAYSDFRISIDRSTWCPRLSVRVNRNADGTYTDRYTTADFTTATAGKGVFLLFTSKGTVYRASNQDVVAEYYRAMGIDDTGKPVEGFDAEIFDREQRHSSIWQMQESNESITQGTLGSCFGGNSFLTVGVSGRMAISAAGNIFEQITSPFNLSNINSIASGDDRCLAVGDDGKIGYALFTNLKSWSLIDEQPFGTERIISVCYGGGLWVAVSESGIVKYSRTGLAWRETPANMVAGGATISYGDTYFLIGDVTGNFVRSLSVASIFAVVTRAEFAALSQEIFNLNESQLERLWAAWLSIKTEVEEALARQLVIGDLKGLPSTVGGTVGETGHASDQGHTHNNSNAVLTSQLGRATQESNPADPYHLPGIPINDIYGRILKEFQTWQRAEASGDLLAPVDENGLIPAQYIDRGVARDIIFRALIAWSLDVWTLRSEPAFEDIGDNAAIYGAAASTTTVVVVGSKGRIAFGPNVRQLQRAESTFGTERIVGVAAGTDPDGGDIFIAVTKTAWAVSRNGEHWSEAVAFPAEIESIMFGGGMFLMPTSEGDIYRTVWTGTDFEWTKQTSSKTVTKGVRCIAFLQGRYVGVGANNLITGSEDAEHWNTEQSPHNADTAWNWVFAGDGVFVTIGDKGRAASAAPGDVWKTLEMPTTSDLHCGVFDKEHYVVAGKNGACCTATRLEDWIFRTIPTSSTVRVAFWNKHACVLATDAGQFVISATAAEALGLLDDDTGKGPSNDDPNPLGDKAFPGLKNTYLRADAVIPDTGVVMEKRVGKATTYKNIINDETGEEIEVVDRFGVPFLDENIKIPEPFMPWKRGEPGGVASLNENGLVPDTELAKGLPGGVPPLDDKGIVPEIHLPPYEIDVEQIVNYLVSGHELEFLEQNSPFNRGPGVSTILHDATYGHIDGNGVYVIAGEPGIGWSESVSQWKMAATQPFDDVPTVGVEFGEDDLQQPIFVAIDTNRRYSVSRTGKDDWSAAVELDGDYDFESICYYNRTFLILCSNGVILRSVFVDGELIGWDEQADSPNITERLNKIAGGNNLYLGVGNGGRIRFSYDASHFATAVSPTEQDLLSACHGKGKFAIGCADGSILTVTDETDIEITPVKPFKDSAAAITGISYSQEDGIFIATNADGGIATSADLTEWVEHVSPSTVRIKAITSGNNRIVLGDDAGNVIASRVAIELNIPGLDDFATKPYVHDSIQTALEGYTPGTGGNVRIGRIVAIDEATGRARACLVDGSGNDTSEIVVDILMLPMEKQIAVLPSNIVVQTTPEPGTTARDYHETWDSLPADEQLANAAINNPQNEVEIT